MRYLQRYEASKPVTDLVRGNGIVAEGGIMTQFGPYMIHTFTQESATTASVYKNRHGTDAAFSFTTSMNVIRGGMMDILIVGGGGGGAGMGGGGGAGGYLFYQNLSVEAGQKIIQVGGGGSGEFSHNGFQQTAGSPSFFGNLIALGGGAGLTYDQPTSNAPVNNGGSGGGAGQQPRPGNAASTAVGIGTPGQGHPGGQGWHGSHHAGGGGGGAAQPGFPLNPPLGFGFTPNAPGNRVEIYPTASPYASFPNQQAGGSGLANDISGVSRHYAGGGGGGGHPGHAIVRSKGGLGGGGEGVSTTVANAQTLGHDSHHSGSAGNGQWNTGGGGGGSTHASHSNSDAGRGGPGIVIVRYRN